MKVLNLFNLLPDNLENAELFFLEVANEVLEEGNLYAHEVTAKAKLITDAFNNVKKMPAFKNQLSNEIAGKSEIFGNYKASESFRAKYDFASCNDSAYNDLISAKKEIEEQIKEREKFLKNIPEDGIATADGEMIEYCQRTNTIVHSVSFIKPKAKKVKDPITELFG